MNNKFTELAKINVNEHTEKKGNLTYLSWAWAVDQLLKQDDKATWEYRWVGDKPYAQIGETVMVFCTVHAFGKSMTAQLPVMDHRNKAIANPNAMDVNTAMQRCLAKAIALHGIGLYIYAGEDLPEGDSTVAKDGAAAPATPVANAGGKSVARDVWDNLSTDEQTWLQDIADNVRMVGQNKGWDKAVVTLEEQALSADHKVAVWSRFDSKERSAMKAKRAA